MITPNIRKMKSTKQNLPDESILEKLRKIARLAEMGYKGEAANARRVLEARLKEYGLTIEDVLTDRKTPREFKYSNKREFRLFLNVIASHFGSKSEEFKTAYFCKSTKKIVVELTDIDFADFAPEWEYYRANFARELRKTEEAFIVAFVNKFDLFDKTPKEGENGKELNKDDLERIRRSLGLMRSIEADPYRKLLEQ